MAMIATMASATSTMVTPRSRWPEIEETEDEREENDPEKDDREDDIKRSLRINGRFMPFAQFSFIATDTAVIVGGNNVDLPSRLATLPNLHA